MELITQLFQYSQQYNLIILVDSSETTNPLLGNYKQLLYVRSFHKNQPYQRWLGYSISQADLLVFLDDDMEVAEPDFLPIIQHCFLNDKVAGMAINFTDKHNDTTLATIPRSQLFKKNSVLKNIIGWLSGYPILPEGKLGFCGIRGKQPVTGGQTEWLSGGAFAAKRISLFKNFNFQLFDLFEQKMGMGEDAIIGYGLSKQGILWYHPQLLFYHNDQKDSAYSLDHFAYARRVTLSRLYLSLEKTRLDNGSYIRAYLHFHWYVFWRTTGILFNYLFKKNSITLTILKGTLQGWKLATKFCFNKQPATIEKWR